MFEKGDFISYGCTGICQVDGIIMMDAADSRKERQYYILKPVYDQKRTIYCPVDNPKVHMRKKLTQEESYRLLEQIPELEPIQGENKKIFEAKCKEAVLSGDCVEWGRLIKTMVRDRQTRHQQGRKITSMNEKYLHEAEERLYGELAVSLSCDRGQIAEMVGNILKEK